MPVTLCVSLWPLPDREAELVRYEDTVLAFLPEHGGRLIARARSSITERDDAGPYETQLIQFPSEDQFASYLADERRAALREVRDGAIERSTLQYVELY